MFTEASSEDEALKVYSIFLSKTNVYPHLVITSTLPHGLNFDMSWKVMECWLTFSVMNSSSISKDRYSMWWKSVYSWIFYHIFSSCMNWTFRPVTHWQLHAKKKIAPKQVLVSDCNDQSKDDVNPYNICLFL